MHPLTSPSRPVVPDEVFAPADKRIDPVRAARPGLLVSVRSREELESIAGLSVDVIDFKEPRQGALAAASAKLWNDAADHFSGGFSLLSAALGEQDSAADLAASVPPRFAFAKAGPSGVQTTERLVRQWKRLRHLLPETVELVAVAYADHRNACCPEPEAIFSAASRAGLGTWLLDTHGKNDGRDSVAWMTVSRLKRLAAMAQESGSRWVLAGSIRSETALSLARHNVRPDWFGVRGDVCDGSRGGRLVVEKVAGWLDLVASLRVGEARGPFLSEDINH
jgi:uncharacterized protein (UPF0264 family)